MLVWCTGLPKNLKNNFPNAYNRYKNWLYLLYNLKTNSMKNLREKYDNARAFLKAGKREEASDL
jgi:hypothetical protein